jgi:hypothetical protein
MKEKEIKKEYYDVVVDCTLPAVVKYRILAESPEQAIEEFDKNKKFYSPTFVKYNVSLQKKIKASVYEASCSVIKFIKKYS